MKKKWYLVLYKHTSRLYRYVCRPLTHDSSAPGCEETKEEKEKKKDKRDKENEGNHQFS